MPRDPSVNDGLDQLDDGFYRLIGKIVVTFNSLEALLRECVAGPLGSNSDLSVVVLTKVNFSELVEMFKITSHVAFQSRPDSAELQKRVSELAKELTALNVRRNIVVHSHYGESVALRFDEAANDVYEEDPILIRTKFKRELNHVLDPSLASEPIHSFRELESELERLIKAYSELEVLSRHLIEDNWVDWNVRLGNIEPYRAAHPHADARRAARGHAAKPERL